MKILHRHDEKIQEIEKLTAQLERSPAVKKMREAEAVEILKARQAAAAKIKELTQELDLVLADDSLEAFEQEFVELEVKRKELKSEIVKKRVDFIQKKAGIEALIRSEEEVLYATYDPKIDDGIEFFQKEIAELRRDGKISTQHAGGVRNIFTSKQMQKFESNISSIKSALKYCQECIKNFETMKLAVFDAKKIEKLKANIPKIVFSSSESEGNLRGLKVPNPVNLLPTKSHMKYKFDTVMEK